MICILCALGCLAALARTSIPLLDRPLVGPAQAQQERAPGESGTDRHPFVDDLDFQRRMSWSHLTTPASSLHGNRFSPLAASATHGPAQGAANKAGFWFLPQQMTIEGTDHAAALPPAAGMAFDWQRHDDFVLGAGLNAGVNAGVNAGLDGRPWNTGPHPVPGQGFGLNGLSKSALFEERINAGVCFDPKAGFDLTADGLLKVPGLFPSQTSHTSGKAETVATYQFLPFLSGGLGRSAQNRTRENRTGQNWTGSIHDAAPDAGLGTGLNAPPPVETSLVTITLQSRF